MRQIKHQQNTVSGCASYSVANLFDDTRFIEDVAGLKFGETTADINRKLQQFMPEVYLTTIFCTNSQFTRNHNRLLDPMAFDMKWETVPEEEMATQARPLLVSFYRPNSGMVHCILVLQEFSTKIMHVVDPMDHHIKEMTIDELLHTYHIVEVCVFGLWDDPTRLQSVCVKKQFLNHLFNN